jgi:hypothetical protein
LAPGCHREAPAAEAPPAEEGAEAAPVETVEDAAPVEPEEEEEKVGVVGW